MKIVKIFAAIVVAAGMATVLAIGSQATERVEESSSEIVRPRISFTPGYNRVSIYENIDPVIALNLQRDIAALDSNYNRTRAQLQARQENYRYIDGPNTNIYDTANREAYLAYLDLERRIEMLDANYEEARLVFHERQRNNESVIELDGDEFELWTDEWLNLQENNGASEHVIVLLRARYTSVLGDIRGDSLGAQLQRDEVLARLEELPEDGLFFFTPINGYITREERIALYEANLTMSNDIELIREFLSTFRAQTRS